MAEINNNQSDMFEEFKQTMMKTIEEALGKLKRDFSTSISNMENKITSLESSCEKMEENLAIVYSQVQNIQEERVLINERLVFSEALGEETLDRVKHLERKIFPNLIKAQSDAMEEEIELHIMFKEYLKKKFAEEDFKPPWISTEDVEDRHGIGVKFTDLNTPEPRKILAPGLSPNFTSQSPGTYLQSSNIAPAVNIQTPGRGFKSQKFTVQDMEKLRFPPGPITWMKAFTWVQTFDLYKQIFQQEVALMSSLLGKEQQDQLLNTFRKEGMVPGNFPGMSNEQTVYYLYGLSESAPKARCMVSRCPQGAFSRGLADYLRGAAESHFLIRRPG